MRQFNTRNRSLDLQQVLAGLQQHTIHAAINQPPSRVRVRIPHVIKADLPQRNQLRPRPQRPRNKARLLHTAVRVGRLASNLSRLPRQLLGPVIQIKLAQRMGRRTEGIGRHHIRPRGVIPSMDLFDNVWASQTQHIRAVLTPHVIRVDRKVVPLRLRPHRPIPDENTVRKSLQQRLWG